jgi:hypothetical protein
MLLKVRVIAPLGSLYTNWITSSLPGYLLISWAISAAVLPVGSSSPVGHVMRISRVLFWVGAYYGLVVGTATWAYEVVFGPMSLVTAAARSWSPCLTCSSSDFGFPTRSDPAMRFLISFHASRSSRLRLSLLSASLMIPRGSLLLFSAPVDWLEGIAPVGPWLLAGGASPDAFRSSTPPPRRSGGRLSIV